MLTSEQLDSIAAHAAKLARQSYEVRLPYATASDPAAGAASMAVSVAVGNIVSPMTEPDAYGALLRFTGNLCRGRTTSGREQALFQVKYTTRSVENATRLAGFTTDIAEVLERCGVDLVDQGRTVRELRAYAATLTDWTALVLTVHPDRTVRIPERLALALYRQIAKSAV
jgi:hypothetical protein